MSDFKEKLVKKLKEDANTIMEKKMSHALDNNNDGTYRNLVQSLDRIVTLIDEYDWQLMWSKWRDENGTQFVSVWEQNSDTDIRELNEFRVDEGSKIELPEGAKVSICENVKNNKTLIIDYGIDGTYFYVEDSQNLVIEKSKIIKGNMKAIAQKAIDIVKLQQDIKFIKADRGGCGLAVLGELRKHNLTDVQISGYIIKALK